MGRNWLLSSMVLLRDGRRLLPFGLVLVLYLDVCGGRRAGLQLHPLLLLAAIAHLFPTAMPPPTLAGLLLGFLLPLALPLFEDDPGC